MKKLKELYQRSSWHPVYNMTTQGGRARSSLLGAMVTRDIVAGLTNGIFYTGLLVGYGIDIVNISILSAVPSICSFFTLFSPLVLSRFKRRRTVLSVTRLLYYAINILGITWLPQVVQSEGGRIAGLIAISFITGAINALFYPGYSPWHMSHITEDIRVDYFSSTTLISFVSSSAVMILASMATDSLAGDAQMNLIIILRYLAFAVAVLDVYLMQKPREPEYKASVQRLSLLQVLKIPLSNRRFALTMLIFFLYTFVVCLPYTTQDAWLLEEVKVSYLYINILSAVYCIFIPLTTPFWSKMMRKHGTFVTLAVGMVCFGITYLAWAFVTPDNYLWLMTLVRLCQHLVGMSTSLASSNLIYVNLPETDQDSYITFHSLVQNVTILLYSVAGTAIVAVVGSNNVTLLGHSFSSVPVLMLIQAALSIVVPVIILALRPWVDPMSPKRRWK